MATTFWDKRSEHYDKEIKQHDSLYDETIRRTKSLLVNTDVVLDFACASGEMSLDLAANVQKINGIDLSVNMIALANQKVLDRKVKNSNFEKTDIFDQCLESHDYSAVIAFNIIHLLDNPSKVLNRFNDLLPTGGLLITQTPCLGEKNIIIQSLINVAQKLGVAPEIINLKYYELESLFSDSNFEIMESEILEEKWKVRWIVARKM